MTAGRSFAYIRYAVFLCTSLYAVDNQHDGGQNVRNPFDICVLRILARLPVLHKNHSHVENHGQYGDREKKKVEIKHPGTYHEQKEDAGYEAQSR